MDLELSHAEMLSLEHRVQCALAAGDDTELDVLGYGEVSVVVLLRSSAGELACKRLPLFSSREQLERYRATFEQYAGILSAAGVRTPPARLWSTTRPDGAVVAYCAQRALPRERVGHIYLRRCSEAQALQMFDAVLDAVGRVITARVGLDVQISNWVADGDGLTYLDVTTPLLRDPHGNEQLDVGLFMSSLPWLLRAPVRWSMSRSIFDKFYSPRGALLDLFGNLHKERLEHLVPRLLPRANAVLSEPLSEAEVRAYYRGDARMWSLLQRLRRADRWWQRAIRRRPYPFLLPGAIER